MVGGTTLFFGALTLVGGAVRQAEYVPSGCDPDAQLLGFCPIEKNGSGLLTIGTVAVIASVGLLPAGWFVLHRYRRAQVAMQRTPRRTWTAGITLRF